MSDSKQEPLVAAGDRGVEQSLGRAAAVLSVLAEARESGLRFTDILRATGFSKATVHRILSGLSAHGFVDTDAGSGRLFLGFRLVAWAAAAGNRFGLAERAEPILRSLAGHTEDTVYFSLRAGEMSVCLARHEGAFPIRALTLKPGDRSPLGIGAGSLALLAFLDDDAEIAQIFGSPAYAAAREGRGMPEERIRRLILTARRLRHAFVDDVIPGMSAIGLPIRARSGRPVAAVSIATISSRLRPPRRTMVLEHLSAAADALQETLGAVLDNPLIAPSSRKGRS